jgi:hypothetical protein
VAASRAKQLSVRQSKGGDKLATGMVKELFSWCVEQIEAAVEGDTSTDNAGLSSVGMYACPVLSQPRAILEEVDPLPKPCICAIGRLKAIEADLQPSRQSRAMVSEDGLYCAVLFIGIDRQVAARAARLSREPEHGWRALGG